MASNTEGAVNPIDQSHTAVELAWTDLRSQGLPTAQLVMRVSLSSVSEISACQFGKCQSLDELDLSKWVLGPTKDRNRSNPKVDSKECSSCVCKLYCFVTVRDTAVAAIH